MAELGTIYGAPVIDDTDRDELLRWAAEDVLGWEEQRLIVCPSHTNPCDWHSEGHRRHASSELLGWPGFGLAVEAAKNRMGIGWHLVILWDDARQAFMKGEDPALTAWAALREALTPKST